MGGGCGWAAQDAAQAWAWRGVPTLSHALGRPASFQQFQAHSLGKARLAVPPQRSLSAPHTGS